MANPAVLEVMAEFGRVAGDGEDAIIQAAMYATAAVASKLANFKEARDLYVAYRAAKNARTNLGDKVSEEVKASKNQVSTFATFMLPAVVKNGELHAQALKCRDKIDPSQRKHGAYNALVAVNRAQKKSASKLTDAEITDIMTKKDVTPKGLMEKLGDLVKAARSIEDNFEPKGMLDVIEYLEAYAAKLQAASEGEDAGDDEGDDEGEEIAMTVQAPVAQAPVVLQ